MSSRTERTVRDDWKWLCACGQRGEWGTFDEANKGGSIHVKALVGHHDFLVVNINEV